VEIDTFGIMPNHVHGIILISDDIRRGTIYRAPPEIIVMKFICFPALKWNIIDWA